MGFCHRDRNLLFLKTCVFPRWAHLPSSGVSPVSRCDGVGEVGDQRHPRLRDETGDAFLGQYPGRSRGRGCPRGFRHAVSAAELRASVGTLAQTTLGMFSSHYVTYRRSLGELLKVACEVAGEGVMAQCWQEPNEWHLFRPPT